MSGWRVWPCLKFVAGFHTTVQLFLSYSKTSAVHWLRELVCIFTAHRVGSPIQPQQKWNISHLRKSPSFKPGLRRAVTSQTADMSSGYTCIILRFPLYIPQIPVLIYVHVRTACMTQLAHLNIMFCHGHLWFLGSWLSKFQQWSTHQGMWSMEWKRDQHDLLPLFWTKKLQRS